ncbi:formamidopyrimidine-DNA glycosylase [Halolactibacillus alkaliphilus]|uniref:Formamidopyrimidine-DNA glycosylase n=1 Tax=Halolactibacillus alkaliphilus TaxID=442899 RepID=A0A511X305_9BACI|nr:DNA-formamidopyrimidine glycosylase [Halolactibacillus alkaliphilus]GEN57324.1 formamidopyrimidine-DNA glycosylase [Halolactibacillus alkaliphilus]GGN72870.1 formamidopyrimidine-DNA glycosylase [Halolactibacillus alkaliphilus]SFO93248.1 DNA-(apurinic or apyrimidinic site) lyase [Halolactibacillus alkaliphilus]
MPELPEVETVRRTLEPLIINKKIKNVTVRYPKMIKKPDDALVFSAFLENQTFREIKRRGKFLLFILDDLEFVSHLRMEGKFGVYDDQTPLNKHTHVIFSFTDGTSLQYNDVRKFGTMHLFKKGEALDRLPMKQIGVDLYLDAVDIERLYPKINKSTRAIKNILLDQQLIAGLGNIYVDETLFRAKVHPMTRGHLLTYDEVYRLLIEAEKVIHQAVKHGGTTIRSYTNGRGEMGMFQQTLYVYGQTGVPCSVCSTAIEKTKVSGRGTHYCPVCQIMNA